MHSATAVEDRTESLAAQAAAGVVDALSELYDSYLDVTYRWAHAKTLDHATAEDITAEVWQRVIKSIHAFVSRGPGSFVKWLFSITRNALVDHWRARTRRREKLTADMLDLDTFSPEVAPDEAAARRELAEKLAKAVNRLSSKQRECVKLRFYMGLSLTETAAVMNIEPNAVKQLQKRAIDRLRVTLPSDVDRNLEVHINVYRTADTSGAMPAAS